MRHLMFPVLDTSDNPAILETLISTQHVGSMCIWQKTEAAEVAPGDAPARALVYDENGDPVLLYTIRVFYGQDKVGQRINVSAETYDALATYFGGLDEMDEDAGQPADTGFAGFSPKS